MGKGKPEWNKGLGRVGAEGTQQIVALNKINKVILLRSDQRLEEGKEIIQVEMWKESILGGEGTAKT